MSCGVAIFSVAVCPDNVPIVYCESNPCENAYCPSHSRAVCRPNYCGSCTAEWFVGEAQVKCSGWHGQSILSDVVLKFYSAMTASASSVCSRPVNSSGNS